MVRGLSETFLSSVSVFFHRNLSHSIINESLFFRSEGDSFIKVKGIEFPQHKSTCVTHIRKCVSALHDVLKFRCRKLQYLYDWLE